MAAAWCPLLSWEIILLRDSDPRWAQNIVNQSAPPALLAMIASSRMFNALVRFRVVLGVSAGNTGQRLALPLDNKEPGITAATAVSMKGAGGE